MKKSTVARSNFNGVNLTNATFSHLFLVESSFIGTNLTGVDWFGTPYDKSTVSRSITKGVDFDYWEQWRGIVVD